MMRMIVLRQDYQSCFSKPDARVWQVTARCVHTHEAIIVMNQSIRNTSLVYTLIPSILFLCARRTLKSFKGN